MKIAMSNDGVFYTLQGEGPYTGQPAIFVRTTGCNAKCAWCDTPYTTFPEQMERDVRDTSDIAGQIINLVDKYSCFLIVYTGGEPMLQQNALQEVTELVAEHVQNKFGQKIKIQFETNGTKAPISCWQWTNEKWSTTFIVSPKQAFAGNENLDVDVDPWFYYNEGIFKVVHEFKSPKCEQMIFALMGKVSNNRIMLMPEGWTFNQQHYEYTAEFCKTYGLAMTSRLHTLIWGHKRAT